MPQNWKTYKLSDIAELVMGQSPKGATTNQVGEGVPLLNGPTEFGYSHPTPTQFTTDPKRFSEVGDVLFCVRGSTTGRMNFADQRYAIGRGIGAFRGKDGYPTKYVKYIIDYYLERMLALCTGSTFPNLSRSDLEDFSVAVCGPEEAKAIASILSAIDDKIENNLAMNKTLEEMAMALYKHWFVDEQTDLSSSLSDYIDLNPRLSLKKGSIAPYVNMKALPTEGMSVSTFEMENVKGGAKFQNGDTLLARITPCLENGKTAFVDFLSEDEIGFGSTEFLVLRPKRGVSKYWVYCLCRYPSLVNHAVSCMIGTSGRQRVQNDPFLQYELPSPNNELMRSFDSEVEPWFKQVKSNINENQTLTQLRDTLLPKLISGEVRVKDVEQTIANAL